MRVIATTLFALGAAGCVWVLLFVPTYVLVSTQHAALDAQFTSAQTQQDAHKSAEESIKSTNALSAQLSVTNTEHTFSSLIQRIDDLAGPAIELTHYRLHKDATVGTTVSVQGNATTRTTLATFSNALESDEWFGSVELPISNLAKDRDISFSMTITVAPIQ